MAPVPDRPADSTCVAGNVHPSGFLRDDGLEALIYVVASMASAMPVVPELARLTAAPDPHRAGWIEITLEAWIPPARW